MKPVVVAKTKVTLEDKIIELHERLFALERELAALKGCGLQDYLPEVPKQTALALLKEYK